MVIPREEAALTTGQEWLVGASGCVPERLRDAGVLASLFEELVVLMELKVVGQPQRHTFPEPGGVTGQVREVPRGEAP